MFVYSYSKAITNVVQ